MVRFIASRSGRILDVLKHDATGFKVSTLKQRLTHRLVLVNEREVRSGADPVAAGDVVAILDKPSLTGGFGRYRTEPPIPILYDDEWLLAVNKPSGLLSVASRTERENTAIRLMRRWLKDEGVPDAGHLHAAHRLDRDASGVLLLARSMEIKKTLAANWHRFTKQYAALVDGKPTPPEGVIETALWEDKGLFVRTSEQGDGVPALTRYRTLKTNGRRSLLAVELGTGRKHQIRVHLASIGCPLVGDIRYGISKAARLALHAERLEVVHPDTGKAVLVHAPVPAEFSRWYRQS